MSQLDLFQNEMWLPIREAKSNIYINLSKNQAKQTLTSMTLNPITSYSN